MMNNTLIEAAKQCPEMVVSIKVADLIEANNILLENAQNRLEQRLAGASAETYLTTEKVCQMLSISVTTLWRWAKRGYLVPFVYGGQKRYRKSDIERILEGGK